ncbi:MAG: hypothetical protein EOP52_13870 [Sphingobacteriales bacterium]|nr:MAG: hypothetical protein EOP52_13870 [Sphingobacteriales bacterium]
MAFYGGDFDSAFKLMDGTGTLIQRPDGSQGFRYVISTDAYNGLVNGDPETLRGEALGRWLGKEQACSKGYTVDKRTDTPGGVKAVVYEGHCK